MSKGKVSLSEIMGKSGADARGQLSLKDLPALLGDGMPELPRDAVGRHRLIRALQQRFGANFRALPGVSDLVKQFDSEVDFEGQVKRLNSIKLEAHRGKSK